MTERVTISMELERHSFETSLGPRQQCLDERMPERDGLRTPPEIALDAAAGHGWSVERQASGEGRVATQADRLAPAGLVEE